MKKLLIVMVLLLPLIAFGQSSTEALDEYRKAGNKGDANAEYNVGRIFHEGRGIAKALLAMAETAARDLGAGSMSLHVFAVNARARGLYERAGYDGELMRYIKHL